MLGGAEFLPSTVFGRGWTPSHEYSLPVARPIAVHSVHSSYGDHSSGRNVVKAVQHAGEKHEGAPRGCHRSQKLGHPNHWDEGYTPRFYIGTSTWRWMEDDVPFSVWGHFQVHFPLGVRCFSLKKHRTGSWIFFQSCLVFCWLFLGGCSARTITTNQWIHNWFRITWKFVLHQMLMSQWSLGDNTGMFCWYLIKGLVHTYIPSGKLT